MKRLRIITVIGLLAIMPSVTGQQFPMYSQYVMNGFLLNPSYAGSDFYTTFGLTVREQWLGIPEAPSTYAASFQTRILNDSYITKSTTVRKKIDRPTKGGRIGLGGYIFSDHNGIMHRTGFQFAYAYHLPIEDEKQLSFGLSLSAYQYFVDINGAVIEDENDEFLANYDQVVYIPDANFGVSYTTRRFFAGFAMTNLFRGSLMIGNGGENGNSQLGHYFLTGGVKFYPGSTDWIIEPSMMLKASDMLAKSIQLDLTARVYYKEDYWLGCLVQNE